MGGGRPSPCVYGAGNLRTQAQSRVHIFAHARLPFMQCVLSRKAHDPVDSDSGEESERGSERLAPMHYSGCVLAVQRRGGPAGGRRPRRGFSTIDMVENKALRSWPGPAQPSYVRTRALARKRAQNGENVLYNIHFISYKTFITYHKRRFITCLIICYQKVCIK